MSSTVSHHLTDLCTGTVNYETVCSPEDTRTDVHSHKISIFQIYYDILLSPEMGGSINRFSLVDQLQVLTMAHTDPGTKKSLNKLNKTFPLYWVLFLNDVVSPIVPLLSWAACTYLYQTGYELFLARSMVIYEQISAVTSKSESALITEPSNIKQSGKPNC